MWSRRQVAVILAVVVMTLSGAAIVYVANRAPASGLIPFQNYGELSSYVTGARSSASNMAGNLNALPRAPTAGAPTVPGPSNPSAPSYSQTNVQVAGVDELDMVKTDGTYLYIASQGEVDILRAYPATDLGVVSRIALENLTTYPSGSASVRATGLFLHGHTLVVVAEAGSYYVMSPGPVVNGGVASMPLYVASQRTYVFLVDVSDAAHPVLEHTLAVTGSVSTGRMVGTTAYLVAAQWIQEVNGTYLVPQVCADGSCQDLGADRIYRDPQSVDAWDYTNLFALNVTSGETSAMAIVTGGYSVLYMSPTSLYLAFFKWSSPNVGPMMTLMPFRMGASWTTIYKLRADGLRIEAVASADVPGSLLSQYAMDEYDGYLRVATTVRDFSGNQTSVQNDVYVFDGAMAHVGSVTGLAPGESIFAVRFLGDRAYVVTFRKIDPLFVIDLSDPTAPRVSGFLEMPGFSEYLYPMDPAHLIGVGKDAIPAIEGNWSWYQGLKLALYNVSDPASPTEVGNVTLGDRGTDSEVLRDPHAFLYVPGAQLVVLPVDLAQINASQYGGSVPPWAWGDVVWQGAYVYRVDNATGFHLVGRLAHGNGTVNATYGWYDSPIEIRRSLYIGDVLYTVSATEVLASSMGDLSEIASVVYATPSTVCPYCVPMPVAAV